MNNAEKPSGALTGRNGGEDRGAVPWGCRAAPRWGQDRALGTGDTSNISRAVGARQPLAAHTVQHELLLLSACGK